MHNQSKIESCRIINLDLTAQLLAELRDRAFPDQGHKPLSDDQYKVLAWMYNAGYDQRLADNPARVNDPNFLKRSENGLRVFNRRDHSRRLLTQGRRTE